MAKNNSFGNSINHINSDQFYATKAIMMKSGSSALAATEDAMALQSMARLNNATPMQILYSQLNSDDGKIMFRRDIYTDMNLYRDPSEQVDLYTSTKNDNSFQTRNIIP